jgi:hypothetical protein
MTKRIRKIPDRRAAIEGEVFTLPRKEGLQVVQPKAEGNDHTNGRWVCISCGILFQNNLEKDLHCGHKPSGCYLRTYLKTRPGGLEAPIGSRAYHVLAWYSFDTGNVEVP